MLKYLQNGHYYFRTAIILHESLLVNGVMTSSEAWHNLTSTDMNELMKIDKMFGQTLFSTPFSTPATSYFLELGILPLSSILKGRRLNFLKYLVSQDSSSMLYKVFWIQWSESNAGDLAHQMKQDLMDLEIDCSLCEIKSISKNKFKKLVKKKLTEFTFKQLLKQAGIYSKLKNLKYSHLKMQSYLEEEKITVKQAKLIFKYRTRMLMQFTDNFRGGPEKKMCSLCDYKQIDSQEAANHCTAIHAKFGNPQKLQNIYSSNIDMSDAILLERIVDFKSQNQQ